MTSSHAKPALIPGIGDCYSPPHRGNRLQFFPAKLVTPRCLTGTAVGYDATNQEQVPDADLRHTLIRSGLQPGVQWIRYRLEIAHDAETPLFAHIQVSPTHPTHSIAYIVTLNAGHSSVVF